MELILLAMLLSGLAGVFVTDDELDGPTEAEGGEEDEIFLGDPRDNILLGLGGNDLQIGGGGGDLIEGGDGNDWQSGGEGNDTLRGDAGNDVMIGGDGSNLILGGAGSDFIESAGLIDEELLTTSARAASSFEDLVIRYDFGSPSSDSDTIDAGPGDDRLVVGGGDVVTLGPGADYIELGDWIDPASPPVIVEDFDPGSDVLAVSVRADAAMPELSVEHDTATGTARVMAGGQILAELADIHGQLALEDLRILTY